ncbi:MAG: glutamate--tRNA ligase [Gammaproteobacteria bacterium RIFCSPHIGHO2_02_FULL_42_13]|nr:MAG: glutamate--tRNA ligase [Gammaproteobacteria bacterium RIFCSPHIGHO2_02_FULL_42_13]
MIVRSRFAPSPTGSMHIGNLRTALYAWLYARKTKGVFILRIEDTDRERSTDQAIQVILDSMQLLNLTYDEGPFYQTKRMDRYREITDQLLKTGHAYRCYCSKERLEALRADQMKNKQKPRYDRCCRDLKEKKEGSFVARFRTPDEGSIKFDDGVRGLVEFQNSELDDLVLVRSDGVPTYNFAVVVDDVDMKVTHVIRGADHINNTPRQINIFNALGMRPPIYAHLPMILGNDGKRLSKRHGALGVLQYREEGILPAALLNYLMRLGWSHGDQEIFSMEEMIEFFDFNKLQKSPATFDPDKLSWLNQHYLKTLPTEVVAKELQWQMDQKQIDMSGGPLLAEVVRVQAERCKTLNEMAEKSRYFYEEVTQYDEQAASKHLTPDIKPVLQEIATQLAQLPAWEKEAIHQVIIAVSEAHQLKLGKVAQPIRVAVTGNTISPPIDETLALIGREKTLKRLQRAMIYK